MRLGTAILILLLLLLLIPSHPYNRCSSILKGNYARDKYYIKAYLALNGTLTSSLILIHVNNQPISLRDLCFHIYPNSAYFRKRGGLFEVLWVKVVIDGMCARAKYRIEGEDGSLLRVLLPKVLPSGGLVNVSIGFVERPPKAKDRYGRWGGIYAFGNWYPILAKMRNGAWDSEPYSQIGESFYSDVANYYVEITVPEGFVVGATGCLASLLRLNGSLKYSWVAENVRDFSWTASREYVILNSTAIVKGRIVEIHAYCLPHHRRSGLRAIGIASKALRIFSKLVGSYLYPSLSICEVYAWFNGMEYPGLVMVSSYLYGGDPLSLEITLAHEIAHQWWGMIVGNDQGMEPWMDEAFAQYFTVIYFEECYGRDEGRRIFNELIRDPYYAFLKERGRVNDAPSRSVWSFDSDVECYVNIVYNKGAWVLRLLRAILGDKVFIDVLRRVYSDYRFKNISIRNFIQVAEDVSGLQLRGFFEDWLFSPGVVSFSIANLTIKRAGGNYLVSGCLYEARGNKFYPLPVTVTFYLEPGGPTKLLVKFRAPYTSFSITLSSKPVRITIDEEDLVPGKDASYIFKQGKLILEY